MPQATSQIAKNPSWLRSSAPTPSKIAGYLMGLLISVAIALAVVFTALQTQSSRVLDQNGFAALRSWAW